MKMKKVLSIPGEGFIHEEVPRNLQLYIGRLPDVLSEDVLDQLLVTSERVFVSEGSGTQM